MWVGGLCGKDPTSLWVGTIQSSGNPENKSKGKLFSLLSGSEILFSCLWTLELQAPWLWTLGFIPVALDWELHHWLPCFSGLWSWTEHATNISGFPFCRWPVMGLLSLNNCVSQFLCFLSIFMQLSLVLSLWRTLTPGYLPLLVDGFFPKPINRNSFRIPVFLRAFHILLSQDTVSHSLNWHEYLPLGLPRFLSSRS